MLQGLALEVLDDKDPPKIAWLIETSPKGPDILRGEPYLETPGVGLPGGKDMK